MSCRPWQMTDRQTDGSAPYLVVDVEKHEVVAARHKEVLTCGVGVHDLVLWSVEDRAVD